MITIKVNVGGNASEVIAEALSVIDGPGRQGIMQAAARAAMNAAISYHREFDQRGGWRGDRYLGPSQGDGTPFGSSISSGWHVASADQDQATIANGAPYYWHKVNGGTIVPKRAQYLTIPLIAAAKGLYAADYERNTGHKLFTIHGRNALFEKVGDGGTESAVSKQYGAYKRGKRAVVGRRALLKRGQQIRPVYALKKSVTHEPWPGALPSEQTLADAFRNQFQESLIAHIESV